ncbi:hypothetical protein B0T16DRAFT_458781 [Cercophora newfieldiana]|uniref:Uncharacterized protein n=1 Tax=Cercophora newfieldiana TaxID=92897 RepID=A0AA39Y7N3_9PEZI|nr:hypothetical protein B0T16DRAFT_458781 [Cercophora newfieldiana]
MDPVSLAGLTAAAVQFAAIAGKGALKGAGLLKTFRGTPARLAELLADVEKSTGRIVHLLGALEDEQSGMGRLLSAGRRTALKDAVHDARRELLASLGLSGSLSTVLDGNSYLTYRLLQDRGIPVPHNLAWGPPGFYQHSIPGMVIGMCVDRSAAHPSLVQLLGILDDLYESGFRDIDTTYLDSVDAGMVSALRDVRSPLEVALGFPLSYLSVAAVSWLLRKGAKVEEFYFEAGGHSGSVNLLRQFQEFAAMGGFEGLSKLVRYAADIFLPTERDCCTCFCSAGGCLPLTGSIDDLVDHGQDQPLGRCFGYTSYVVFWWMESCGLGMIELLEDLEQGVRLEIFHRLGMVHTCCRGVGTCKAPPGTEDSGGESSEIRQEDKLMALQLDLIMKAYRASMAAWLDAGRAEIDDSTVLTFHWQQWWRKLDQVLPDTKGMADAEAAGIQALTLKQRGFEGAEFEQVI